MQKIKVGEDVVVTTGKDKGKVGAVIAFRKKQGKIVAALVKGINLCKKTVKADPNTGDKGGFKEKEAYIDYSNIAAYNPVSKKADKVGIKKLEDGKRVRYFKSDGEMIDV